MSTASTESGHGYDTALDEGIQVGDLLDDPRTDAEALCLCSLLWSPTPTARAITTTLSSGDFHRPVYGELFNTIAEQVAASTPHDPASIAAALTQAGRTAGHRGTQRAGALTQASMAGSPPESAGHYASPWSPPPTAAASTPPPRRWPRPPNNYPKTSCSTIW